MKNQSRNKRIRVLFSALIGVALLSTLWLTLPVHADVSKPVREAWTLMNQVGKYDFSATIEQVTHPAPALSNVGKSSTVETYHVSGNTDINNHMVLMRLYQSGGSVLNAEDGVEVRVEDGKAYGRTIGAEWKELKNVSTSAYTTGNDASGFLTAATHVRRLDDVDLSALQISSVSTQSTLSHYSFNIDPDKFAGYMRDQMVTELQRSGKLPAGMELSISDEYRGMSGSGEVWLDQDGLPVRMLVNMLMPAEESGEQVEATITTDYTNPARENLLVNRSFPARLIGSLGLPQNPNDLNQIAAIVGLVSALMACMLYLVSHAQKRLPLTLVSILVIFSMVFTPIWQDVRAASFYEDMNSQQQQARVQAQQEKQQQEDAEKAANSWDAHTSLAEQAQQEALALTSYHAGANLKEITAAIQPGLTAGKQLSEAASSDDLVDTDKDGLSDSYEAKFDVTVLNPNNADTDADTLSDSEEVKLGLQPGAADSDGDSIPDQIEIKSFHFNNQDWYLNPASKDTDGDGILDGLECPQRQSDANGVCQDTDGDGTPDVFDLDSDGDSVPDSVDLSAMTIYNQSFSREAPFKLAFSALNDAKPVFVDYQLRPTDAKHLNYTLNVLDWPSGDTKGQITRISNTTFADSMTSSQKEGDPKAGNGDLRLIPMLEVRLKGAKLPLPLTREVKDIALSSTGLNAKFTLSSSPTAPGKTTLQMTQADSGPYRMYTGDGDCSETSNAALAGQMGQGDSLVLNNSLADMTSGSKVLFARSLSGSTIVACAVIPAVAHGTLTDQVVDDVQLTSYGATAFDTDNHEVMLYAPLSLVYDDAGSTPVAFQARVPFLNSDQAFQTTSQEVRMVWLLNMITDSCKPIPDGYNESSSGTWCDAAKPERWVTNVPSVIQSYPDTFNVTGVNVKMDYGVDMAVVFENPAVDTNKNIDDPLWGVASGLQNSFLAGRTDMTVAEIEHRFSPDHNSDIERTVVVDGKTQPNPVFWGQDPGVFVVKRYQYDTSDGISDFISTRSTEIFQTYFNSVADDKKPDQATLLFARTENVRNLTMDTFPNQCSGDTCTLNFTESQLVTQNILNWSPYRRADSTWTSYPLEEYLDHLEATYRMQSDYKPESYPDVENPKEYVDGLISLVRMYYESLSRGMAAMVAVDGTPLLNAPSILEDQNIYNTFYRYNSYAQVATKVVSFVAETIMGSITKFPHYLYTLIFGGVKDKTILMIKALGKGLVEKIKSFTDLFNTTFRRVALGVGVGIAAVALVACTIMYLVNSKSLAGKIGGRVLFASIGLLTAGLAIKALKGIYDAGKTISNASKGAAVIGAVIGGLITWGVFFATWGISGAKAGSLAANSMLADAIAATVTVVLMAALSCTVVGAVIVAVIGLIDSLISIACAAAGVYELDESHWARQYICIGLSGWITKIIKWFIYSNTYMIDYSNTDRLQFGNMDEKIQHPENGMTVGNALQISIEIENTIKLSSVPLDWKALLYAWQYSSKTAKSSAFRYKLQASEADLHDGLDRGDVTSVWQSVPNESKKWLGKFTASTDGYAVPLSNAGINRDPTLYFSEGSAVPVQECWVIPVYLGVVLIYVPVCYIRTERATINSAIGSNLTSDILPASLDDFYSLTATGNDGYALSWGRDAALTFPTMKDADGDGLVTRAYPGGNDPNDQEFDTDHDGLSDLSEIQAGTNANMPDSDDDGLWDSTEVAKGTDPLRKDTDGDGLTDAEELAGWLFTYGFNPVGSPFTTMVYPDPTVPDTDFDGITDLQERIFGYNPNVPESADLLEYEMSKSEFDAPQAMLRFEEDADATLFTDSANYGFNATCSASACPISGQEGRYGKAIRMDGSDDVLDLTTSAQNISFVDGQTFTVAAWVNPQNGGTILSKWSEEAGSRTEMRLELTGDRRLQWVGYNGATVTSTASVPADGWTHVAVSYDGANVNLYIGGVLNASAAMTNNPGYDDTTTPSGVRVGAYQAAGALAGFYSGKLDELAIFDRALTQDEIYTGLMGALYNFNDEYVRPGEKITLTSTVTNKLNSRYSYGLLTTTAEPQETILNWRQSLLPKTFVLYPDNPALGGINTAVMANTLQIDPAITASHQLNLTQSVNAQIVDRRTESNMAELWLKFNEAADSTTFIDSSGNMPLRNVTCASGACPLAGETGVLNTAIHFVSGQNTPVTLPTLSTLNLVNRGYSIAMWVKPSAAAGLVNLPLLSASGDPIYVGLTSFGSGGYTPVVKVNGAGVTISSVRSLANDIWSYLVVQYEEGASAGTGTLYVYVNGAKVAVANNVAAISSGDSALSLGGSQLADFMVDDLRIFSRPLSAMELNQMAERPVLQLDLDDSSFADSSVYHQNVSVPSGVASPALTDNSVNGKGIQPGSGNTAGFLNVAGNALLDMSDGAFSFSVWVNPNTSLDSLNYWQGIFGNSSGTANAYPSLERKGLKVRFGFGDGSAFQSKESAGILRANAWNHLAVTFQPSTTQTGKYEYKLYVNSVYCDGNIFSSKPSASSSFLVGHTSRDFTSSVLRYHVDDIAGDGGSHVEPYLKVNGSRTLSWGSIGAGDTVNVNYIVQTSSLNTYHYEMWEEDDNPDDFAGEVYHHWYDLPTNGEVATWMADGFHGYLYTQFTRPSIQFSGNIDELQVYRYALDTEQIYDLYHSIPVTASLPLDDRPASETFENHAMIGSQHAGVCTSGNCPAAGLVGLINQATRFDGGSDQIAVPVDTTPDYMVSLWVKSVCTDCGIYSLKKSDSTVINQLYFKNGNVCALTGATPLCTHTGQVSDGQWHHLVYSNDGSTASIWLDGQVDNRFGVSSAIPAASSGSAVLGQAPAAANPGLDGELDDVRVFRYTQSDEGIAQLRERAPLLLAHLDENTAGAGWKDATTNGWTFTCDSGSNNCPQAGVQGRLSGSVQFDGLNDMLSLNQAQLSGSAQDFSLFLWVKPGDLTGKVQTLAELMNTNGSMKYTVELARDDLSLCVRPGAVTPEAACLGGTSAESYVQLIKNNWNLVTLTVHPLNATTDEIKLFINGYLDHTFTHSSGNQAGIGKVYLGNRSESLSADLAGPFNGQLDEVSLRTYVVNDLDVRDMFLYQMAEEEAHQSLSLTVDADAPTVDLNSYNDAFHYVDGKDHILDLEASDATSGIGIVELRVQHRNAANPVWVTAPVCTDSVTGQSYCPTFNPGLGDGTYTLTARATDHVGHQAESGKSYEFLVDNTGPVVTINQSGSQVLPAYLHPYDRHTWYLRLSGKIIDDQLGDGAPGSGLDTESPRVTITSQSGEVVGAGTQIPTLTETSDGYAWALDYLFPEMEPTGNLTIRVEAKDKVGNLTTRTLTVLMDASPSTGTLKKDDLPQIQAADLAPAAERAEQPVLSGGVVTGTASDTPGDAALYAGDAGKGAASGVSKVQVAFNPSVDVSYLFNEPYPQGLLAWLPLDNDQAPTGSDGNPDPTQSKRLFMDISPYQISGECDGESCPQAGASGHKISSMQFNGNNQWINLGQQVDLSKKSFTVSVWAKRDQSGRSDPILWQGPATVAQQRFLFGVGPDDHFVCGFGGSDLVAPAAITDTGWHYWACTFDQASGRRAIFQDGQQVAEDTAAEMPAMNENLMIGSSPLGSFMGSLDELVILNNALGAEQLREQYTGYNTVYQTSIVKNFYTGGDAIPDRSGFYQSAQLVTEAGDTRNKVVSLSSDQLEPAHTADYALNFDGQDRLEVAPSYSLLLDRGAFTQTAWVKPAGSADQAVISQFNQNPEQRYPSLMLTADNRLKAGFGDGYTWKEVATPENVVTPGAWNFIAATFDGSSYKLYVNGVLRQSSVALSGEKPYPSNLPFSIGDGFTGAFDGVRIYTRALSDLEIQAMAGAGWRDSQLTGSANGQVSWQAAVADGLEGAYNVDVRGIDNQGHFDSGNDVRQQWSGVIDTLAPRFSFSSEQVSPDDPYHVRYTFTIEDTQLDATSIKQNLCSEADVTREYNNSSWVLLGGIAPNSALYRLSASCVVDTRVSYTLGVSACDVGGHCATRTIAPLLANQVYLPAVLTDVQQSADQQQALKEQQKQQEAALREQALGWPGLVEARVTTEGDQGPSVSILSGAVTPADVRSILHLNLKGTVESTVGISAVNFTVEQNGQAVFNGQASVSDGLWNGMWIFTPGAPPADGEYTLRVTAIDKAGLEATVSAPLTVSLRQ